MLQLSSFVYTTQLGDIDRYQSTRVEIWCLPKAGLRFWFDTEFMGIGLAKLKTEKKKTVINPNGLNNIPIVELDSFHMQMWHRTHEWVALQSGESGPLQSGESMFLTLPTEEKEINWEGCRLLKRLSLLRQKQMKLLG